MSRAGTRIASTCELPGALGPPETGDVRPTWAQNVVGSRRPSRAGSWSFGTRRITLGIAVLIIGMTACGNRPRARSAAGSTTVQDAPTSSTKAPAPLTIEGVYVLPSDGVDHGLAANGTLTRAIAAMQAWFSSEAGGTHLRWSTDPIKTVRIDQSDAAIASSGAYVRDRVEAAIVKQGFNDPQRLYAVWYDGSSTVACGGGALPPTLVGHVAALYLQGRYANVVCANDRFSSDGVTPEVHDVGMLHEILHTMGYVAACAPHATT